MAQSCRICGRGLHAHVSRKRGLCAPCEARLKNEMRQNAGAFLGRLLDALDADVLEAAAQSPPRLVR